MSDVVTSSPLNRHVSWVGLEPDITPIDAFFCRNHNQFPSAPESLDWHGVSLSPEQLGALPQVAYAITLECAGNGRTDFLPLPEGTPWGIRGMSTAHFQGVSLETLLAHYPAPSDTEHLIFRGADQGEHGFYERSLPIDEALRRGAFIALRMNDVPLPLQHGAPCRLIVPSYFAMASVKWLRQIEFSVVSSQAYYQVEDYLVVSSDPSEPARPSTTMRPKSILVHPAEGQAISGGRVQFRGKAWSGEGQVSALEIELSGPDGKERISANFGTDLGPHAWRSFSAQQNLIPGSYTAQVFCRAGDGFQPEKAMWNPQGYENNSAHTVKFQVTAES